MPRILILLFLSSVFGIYNCSQQDADRYSKFADCWHFRRVSQELYEVEFEAIVYPGHGTIAYNKSCPQLRMRMIFQGAIMPADFNVFAQREASDPGLWGIRGLAVVSMQQQQDPDAITVTVQRLISGQSLSDNEATVLQTEMRLR